MNRKFVLSLALVLSLLAWGQKAEAIIGTIDVVPSSTLLLPYFEVDLDNQTGINTLFSINNTSASATLAHVTVWTDWSIPVLDFDVYLTGFDVATISLFNVFVNGTLPPTASDGQDPTDTISPQGPISQDINFASCTGFLPYDDPAINAAFRAHLRAVLTGKPSPSNGNCASENHGDNIARGYITIDVSNACSQQFPSDTGYFVSGGGGIAGNRNILVGDYFLVNPGQDFAQGNTMVHIEASAATLSTPGEYTFYGRYVAGTAIDNREPTATTFFARFITGPLFDAGTDFLVWRDSKFVPGSSCLAGPNYGELFEQQIVVFDEREEPFVLQSGGPSGEPVPGAQCIFCNETQRVAVGTDLDTGGFDFGWIYLNLNHATVVDAALGPGYVNIAQAWVVDVMNAEGRYSVGYDAFQMDNANTAVSGGVILPVNTP